MGLLKNEWAKDWQVEFNLGKCEVIHFMKRNQKAGLPNGETASG